MTQWHTLYLLHCGWLIEQDESGGTYRIQVPSYLIVSAAGKRYLVDTGNPATLIGASNCEPWYQAGCEITPADDPLARLRELGLSERDIDGVIATHFDFDHAGRYDAFGSLGTEVWVQRAHIGSALSNQDRYSAELWNIPGLRWRVVDGDFAIEPGLQLIRTDGHAVGHQSISVVIEGGMVILAADAIDSRQMFESRKSPDYYDPAAFNTSVDRLAAIADETGAQIIFGHDPEQWASLPKSPVPYRAG
jgi:N-acyl homoserine lactone hydrolase